LVTGFLSSQGRTSLGLVARRSARQPIQQRHSQNDDHGADPRKDQPTRGKYTETCTQQESANGRQAQVGDSFFRSLHEAADEQRESQTRQQETDSDGEHDSRQGAHTHKKYKQPVIHSRALSRPVIFRPSSNQGPPSFYEVRELENNREGLRECIEVDQADAPVQRNHPEGGAQMPSTGHACNMAR
jgi:hypothetical protein